MILSHHLTVVYFILVVLGVWLISKYRLSLFASLNFRYFPFLTLFTSISWLVYGVLVFPSTLVEWSSSLPNIVLHRGQYPSSYTSTGVGSFIGQPVFDKVAFVAVPIFIGGLFLLYLYFVHRREGTHSGRLRFVWSWAHDKLAVLDLGMLSMLGLAFVFGLAFSGVLYPIRSLEYVLFLMSILGSNSLVALLSAKQTKVRLLIFLLAIAVTILSIYWTYHIIYIKL